MEKHGNNEPREELSADRLCEAAEAALRAAHENAAFTGAPAQYPLDLMGTPVQPECLAPFTRFEIEQACEFLVRLGELESPSRRKGG